MLTVSCRNDASQQEDMSDQEGVASASNPEATLTHPSARDTMQSAGVVHIASSESSLADHDKHGNPSNKRNIHRRA